MFGNMSGPSPKPKPQCRIEQTTLGGHVTAESGSDENASNGILLGRNSKITMKGTGDGWIGCIKIRIYNCIGTFKVLSLSLQSDNLQASQSHDFSIHCFFHLPIHF